MDRNVIKLLWMIAAAPAIVSIVKCVKKKNTRSRWVEPWLSRRNEGRGVLNMLHNELQVKDPHSYKQFIRMCAEQFKELLDLTKQDITKENTVMRESVSAENRLAITLRFLATGESFRSLMFATRIHENTISLIVPEVCNAIYKRLKDNYLKMPQSPQEWEEISNAFGNLWQFPLCLGAIDGKHINFRAPRSAGSYFYNYKKNHSIVLLAVASAEYKFIYVSVGVNGRVSDGGVYRESTLKEAIAQNILNFPKDKCLSGENAAVPYTFIADDAFPLSKRIMKPFSSRNLTNEKRIFNYRLSRARRVVENSCGILANRFRVLFTTINLSPEKVELITLTCCVLHNFLATKNSNYTIAENFTATLPDLVESQGGNRPTDMALTARDIFMHYFNNNGSVSWQNKCL